MNSLALRAIARAGAPVGARPDTLERRLRRFHADVQPRVRALAAKHPRLADLAGSFPALLFALATPRARFRAEPVIANVIAGRDLKSLAEDARLALWMRKLEPEMLRRPLPALPANEEFAKRIVNHIPRHAKFVPDWLDAVAFAARWSNEDFAVWYAHNFPTKRRPEPRLALLCLWSWFSDQAKTCAHGLLERPWNARIEYKAALDAANKWHETIDLYVNLGDRRFADVWLAGDVVDGFEFVPLLTADDVAEEARAMKNCLRTFGQNIAHDFSRFWSVRKDGKRVATLRIGWWRGHALLSILELKAEANQQAPIEVWQAAGRWQQQLGTLDIRFKGANWGSVPLDRKMWIAFWRPYWLAKKALPSWLPLGPSRNALYAL